MPFPRPFPRRALCTLFVLLGGAGDSEGLLDETDADS